MNNLTVIVTRDNKEVARFENQSSDFEGFKYLLNHNSCSTMWAVRYEGWDVEVIDNKNNETSRYSDEYRKHKH